VDAVAVLALAALTGALAAGWLLDLDIAVRDWVDGHRPPTLDRVAQLLNYLGQGGPLAIGCGLVAVVLAVRRRTLWPLLPVPATYLLILLTVGPLKVLTDRAAPHKPADVAHREEFFSGGLSYPSGHAVNAIVWYALLVLLLGTALPAAVAWALRIAPAVVVSVVTTYLAYHWLTDTVAGVLVGLVLERILRRVLLRDRGWLGRRRPAEASKIEP
jgi:membrane-associated phospholipid phosphatase